MSMSPRLLRPRATGFDPRSISGLWAWLDGADLSTMTLNGSTVSEWRSKSGEGGIVLAQATASAQPTLTSGYYAGRSALTFDGNDFLRDSDSGLPINGSTIAVVFDETTRVSFGGVVVANPASGSDSATTSGYRLSVHEGTNVASSLFCSVANNIDARSPLISESSALGKHVVVVTIQPSVGGFGNAVMRYDGTAGAEDTLYAAPSATSTGTVVGGRFVSGAIDASYRFNGKICEILSWSRAITASEAQRAERYLGTRWGVVVP